jgi:hypothetical protein
MMSGLQPFGHNLDLSPSQVFLAAGTHPTLNFLDDSSASESVGTLGLLSSSIPLLNTSCESHSFLQSPHRKQGTTTEDLTRITSHDPSPWTQNLSQEGSS